MPLKVLGQGQGYLKAGFFGFNKSGKTYTATLLAIAAKRRFKLAGPIAFFDTEGGSEYVAPLVRSLTGQDPVGEKSRQFVALVEATKQCEQDGAAVLIVDSITHVWRELCESWLAEINAGRAAKNLPARNSLEFQDWSIIKARWNKEWADLYLNSKLHLIICGRAGFEWDMSRNEETGRNELLKTGTKMKTETEFGFEPSLLVEMEQIQNARENTVQTLRSKKPRPSVSLLSGATIRGDRFGVIHGAFTTFTTLPASDKKKLEKELAAVDRFFAPHLDLLVPNAYSPIDTDLKSEFGIDESGDAGWYREKRDRKILSEEIQGVIVRMYPGQTAVEKKAKADILDRLWKTRSWTKVEEVVPIEDLKAGLATLRNEATVAELSTAAIPPNGGAELEATARTETRLTL